MPILLPITLLALLLALLLPFTTSQQLLEFLDNTPPTHVTIPPNETITRRIELPSRNAILRLEWTSLNHTAYPTTLFYLSNTSASPIRFSGKSLDHNPAAANHTCDINHPCATVSTIDFEAFYTRSTRSFLRLPLEEGDQRSVFVTVFNYQIKPTELFTPPSPVNLTGKLSAKIVTSDEDCPGGVFPDQRVCNSRGKCVKSRCECDNDYGGRACDTRVIQLPTTNKPPNEKFLITPPPNSYTARINLFTGVVFSAKQQNPGTVFRFEVLLLRGRLRPDAADTNTTESREAPNVWLFHAPPSLGEPLLKENVTLPTLGHSPFAINQTEKTICVTLREGQDTTYFGFYALPIDDMTDGYALVNINQTETSPGQCSPGATALPLGLALVPAFLVTTAVAATAVLVMVWLDCRHGFTNRVDRLSNVEIERMYPSTPYRGEVLECPICISEIEPAQHVRNLKCNHVYHTECLDPWLTENRASCPTCRTDVRVDQLSDKRHMRRIVQFFLAPLVYLRHLRETRSGEPLVDQPSPDLETGDAGDSLNPERNHQHDNTDITQPETANDTSATQPVDVTPQSQGTDIAR